MTIKPPEESCAPLLLHPGRGQRAHSGGVSLRPNPEAPIFPCLGGHFNSLHHYGDLPWKALVKVTADTAVTHKDYFKMSAPWLRFVSLKLLESIISISSSSCLPHSIKATWRFELVEGTLIIALICMRVTVRPALADQQERSSVEGSSLQKNTASGFHATFAEITGKSRALCLFPPN